MAALVSPSIRVILGSFLTMLRDFYNALAGLLLHCLHGSIAGMIKSFQSSYHPAALVLIPFPS